MSTPKKKVSVSKRPSAEQIQDANRWTSFIKASGLSYEQLSEEWLEFFDAQADVVTAGTELIRLIDIAIEKQNDK